ncbi:MAG: Rieske 2Fe-2S domain-containing protein [Chloroflexi bacterium]|nr:Rieske 2Fe-2S domain-containing protein [Chloroflexota bacterium]
MVDREVEGWVAVGPLADLIDGEPKVVRGAHHSIAVFAATDRGAAKVWAVDNRCPHMGFPLSRGTICDGVLTCHWHHARFELETGGTFDPFADDVAVHAICVVDGVVYVDPEARRGGDRLARESARLRLGMEQELNLVLAKSVLGLLADVEDVGVNSALSVGAGFGVTQRRAGWGAGLTILTAMENIVDRLDEEDRAIALFHGLVHVAGDSAGMAPRFPQTALPTRSVDRARLRAWFRNLIDVRNADGAERVLAAALASGVSLADSGEILMAAATDHFYVSGGHVLDFTNKAVELLIRTGGDAEQSSLVLGSLVRGLATSTRSEEQNAWRSPIDLVDLARLGIAALPERLAAARVAAPLDLDAFANHLLADDPRHVIGALDHAFQQGVAPAEVALGLCVAAVVRVARFSTANELGDWITVLHTLTYCNALHRGLTRTPTPEVARGIYHGAISLYLDRFLNVPPARMPEERDDPGATGDTVRARLLDQLDRQGAVQEAAALVDGYLRRGEPAGPLWAALGACLVREDAEFHTYQMVEAGARLFGELAPRAPELARVCAIATARYLAAHAPTQRELLQTARIAQRLRRGEGDAAAP